MFTLDPRLENGSLLLADLPLCRLFFSNNACWPWLILVPRRGGMVEPTDIPFADKPQLYAEIEAVSLALKKITGCQKVNIAAIGNIVRQLHIHIVARNEGDADWPGPIWGSGHQSAYEGSNQQELAEKLKEELGV